MSNVVYTDRLPVAQRINGQLNYWKNLVGTTNTTTLVGANATCTALAAAMVLEANMGTSAPPYMLTKACGDTAKAIMLGVKEGLWAETHTFATVADFVAATDSASSTARNNLFG